MTTDAEMQGPVCEVPSEYAMRPCPICTSPYMVFVTKLKTRRTKRDLPIYCCLTCQSFSNPSGYVENDATLCHDLEWHKGVTARNESASQVLLDRFKGLGVDISRIVEIGAGTGTFLKVASAMGSTGIGHDINPCTQPYARDVNGMDVRAELWTADTDAGPFSLMACVSVLEHIPEPRALIENMVRACIREGAALYISVPFVDPQHRHRLTRPTPGDPVLRQRRACNALLDAGVAKRPARSGHGKGARAAQPVVDRTSGLAKCAARGRPATDERKVTTC